MTFRMGICDDESMFTEKFKKYWEGVFSAEFLGLEVKIYQSGEELIDSEDELDLIFLDMEMGDGKLSGLDVKNYFAQANNGVRIIYVTSHDELMAEAFGKNVYGFVNKRTPEKAKEILARILTEVKDENEVWQVYNEGSAVYVKYKDIIYIKAENVYINIFTKDGKYSKRITMKECEEILADKEFYRIHKSYIINIRHLCGCSAKNVIMSNHTELKISRGAHTRIDQRYKQFILKKGF